MKFEISRESLVGAMDSLRHIKSVRYLDSGLAIESSVAKLEFTGDFMHVSACRDGLAIKRDLEITKLGDFKPDRVTAVDAAGVYNALKKKSLPKTLQCEINKTTDAMLVKVGNANMTFKLIDPDDSQLVHMPEKSADAPTVNAAALRGLIKSVMFASPADKPKARLELAGVNLKTSGHMLVAAATDGYRMARYAIPCPVGLFIPDGVTLPIKNVPHILDFLEDVGDLFEVAVHADNDKFMLSHDRGQIVTYLVDSRYPDLSDHVSDRTLPISLDYQQFMVAIDRCMSVSTAFAVVRQIEGEPGLSVEAWTHKNGVATAQDFIDFDGADGLAAPVAFNPKFMLDALKGGREVRVDFGDGVGPIRICGELDGEYYASMMPMRVSTRNPEDI